VVDIEWLRTFVVAAREENFRRAAEELYLAQPTVSGHIDRLERALGTPLFHRVGRSVRLHDRGRRFLPFAVQALEAVDQGRLAVERLVQGFDASVTLAVSPLVAATYLPRFIHGFHEAHPTVDAVFHVAESRDIPARVAAGEADVGLALIPGERWGLLTVELYQDPMILVAPPDPYDLDGPPPAVDDLCRRYPMLTHSHPLFWDDLVRALTRRFPFLRTIRVEQMQVSARWVEQGLGMSILPLSLVRAPLALGRMVAIEVPELEWPTSATYLMADATRLSEAATAFVRYVREYMAVRAV
jgi:LysR family transcriptional repressor of citA